MPTDQNETELTKCNRCGFCQSACPVFRATGHESGVARGRLAMISALSDGRLDWTDDLADPLFNCLLCGACTANCFPAIATADLVVNARGQYLDKLGPKKTHRLLFRHLPPYPRRLHWAARAVALGKISGLSTLARSLGLLRIFGRDFASAQDIIGNFPLRPLRGKIKPGTYTGEGPHLNCAYFLGCGVDIIQQEAGTATFNMLRRKFRSVRVLDNSCCGLPPYSYGDQKAAKDLATRNLGLSDWKAYDLIVSDCSSCASFLKKYPRLFDETDREAASARAFADRIKDAVEAAGKPVGNSLDEISPRRQPLVVTYHDPCHACRGQQIVDQPRAILQHLSGIDYVEMPESDWCCGGAGAYALSHFEISGCILERKIANLQKTGAGVVATSCPACMIQLKYGIRRRGLKVAVKHISEFA